MPASFIIDHKYNCVFIRRRGVHQVGEQSRQLAEIVNHPDFERGMNFFIDLREMDYADASFGGFMIERGAWQEVAAQTAPCKMASLHASERNYGASRQATIAFELEGVERRPFSDLQEALEFLGLPADLKLPTDDDADD